MSAFTLSHRVIAGGMLAGLAWAAPAAPAVAQQKTAVPDFSSNQTGWIGIGGGGPNFGTVAGRASPVTADPAHPFVPNGTRAQPTYRIGDLSNPNLKPWVKERMKKDNDEVLAGKIAFTARSSCMPAGVPGFMAFGGATPLYFVQTPAEVLMIFEGDHQVRRVYLDASHSENPKPSWYGESVGHYEGDTLVIDTIGQNTKTVVDPYRTPHSEKLHVVERWQMIDDDKAMEVTFTVEDADAFNEPWSGTRRYRRVQQGMLEDVCAENNQHLFDYHIPVANTPDF
jgi:hypothetical protein